MVANKGTEAMRQKAAHASHSRIKKLARVTLKKGTPEHFAMRSALTKRVAAERKAKGLRIDGRKVIDKTTGVIYNSMAQAAESLPVSNALLCYHMKRTGVCKGHVFQYV